MNDTQFADLIIALAEAEKLYLSDPKNEDNFKYWTYLSREYQRALRERLDVKWTGRAA